MRTTCMPGTCGGQEKASAPLKLELDGCEPPCGFWEINPCPLQEQALLPTETSLQAVPEAFLFVYFFGDRVSFCSPDYPGTPYVD